MTVTGNSLIDGDTGMDPQSPYFDEAKDAKILQCYWCGEEDYEEEFTHFTESGQPVCNECVKEFKYEGIDYRKELK